MEKQNLLKAIDLLYKIEDSKEFAKFRHYFYYGYVGDDMSFPDYMNILEKYIQSKPDDFNFDLQ